MNPLSFAVAVFSCVLAFLALASPNRIEADEALKNGDFSEGINNWTGDGEDVAQAAPDLAPKGMIVKLRSDEWTKAVQDFTPEGTAFDCSITYKLSADAQFSDKDDDYKNVPGKISYTLWKKFRIPKGDWMMMISDFGEKVSGTYFPIKPAAPAEGTATFRTKLTGLSNLESKTITLAFPPGHGSVIILNVSLTNSTGPTNTPSASDDNGAMLNQALDLVRQAWNPGGDPPSDADRTDLLNKALTLAQNAPQHNVRGHRVKAIKDIKAALDAIKAGDPNQKASGLIHDAEEELRTSISIAE